MILVHLVTDSPVLRARLGRVIDAAGDMLLAGADEADVSVVVADDFANGSADRPALVLLDLMDATAVRDAYAAGASAVLSIDASDQELVGALRALAAGLVVLPPAFAGELLGAALARRSDLALDAPAPAALTRREADVLALLAQGHANKVIAARLGITEHTVKTHIAAVYEKLDARNRAEAVVAAARQGLITL